MIKRMLTASVVCLLSPLTCPALEFFQQTTPYALTNGAELAQDSIVQAPAIRISGLARDDLFLLAGGATTNVDLQGRVNIDGQVEGDVWAVGSDLLVGGHIQEHVRAVASHTLTVTGRIDRGLSVLARSVALGETARIRGDVLVAAESLLLDGTVEGTVVARGTRVTLSGTFGSNVTLSATDLTVTPTTRIAGDLTYTTPGELVLDDRVHLGGRLVRGAEPPTRVASTGGNGAWILQVFLLCGAWVAGIVLATCFPAFIAGSARQVVTRHWRCLLTGAVVFCLMPMLALLMILTLVGLPLALVMTALTGIGLYVAKFPVALALAQLAFRRGPAPVALWSVMTLGLVVVYAGVNLPHVIGIAVWSWVTLTGLGAMILTLTERRHLAPLPPPPLPPEPTA